MDMHMIDMLQTISKKIAIIGTARAGKTVFLTSLLNHLIEHNRTDFVVGNSAGVQIADFKQKPVPPGVGAKFNYGACRDALVHNGRWPEKTKDTSHFICDFRRSDWKFFRSKLHFFDVPGERFADVSIGQHENYADWSDHMLEYILSDTVYRTLSEPLLNLQQAAGNSINMTDILAAYRETLANYFLKFKPAISPSTFILDQDGNTPKSKTREDFLEEAKTRPLGLPPHKDKILEFAPLSAEARENNPDLTKAFEYAYKAYRKKIVMPLLEDLKSSNRLIILIDIPSLLNGGVAMYNDNREILDNLFVVLEPESWFWRLMLLGTNKGPAKIDRIAFVATKSDATHPIDVEEGRLLDLLRQMTEKFAYSLSDVEVEWFTCSAVVSAKAASGDYAMRGTLVESPAEGEIVYYVSKLPERWPQNWQQGDYRFPTVLPRVPANRGIAPEQHGLDKIFSFITKD